MLSKKIIQIQKLSDIERQAFKNELVEELSCIQDIVGSLTEDLHSIGNFLEFSEKNFSETHRHCKTASLRLRKAKRIETNLQVALHEIETNPTLQGLKVPITQANYLVKKLQERKVTILNQNNDQLKIELLEEKLAQQIDKVLCLEEDESSIVHLFLNEDEVSLIKSVVNF